MPRRVVEREQEQLSLHFVSFPCHEVGRPSARNTHMRSHSGQKRESNRTRSAGNGRFCGLKPNLLTASSFARTRHSVYLSDSSLRPLILSVSLSPVHLPFRQP
jgi:hypothetical protein